MINTPVRSTQTNSPDDSGDSDADAEPTPKTILRSSTSSDAIEYSDAITLRAPVKQEGHVIYQLIKQCPPLDLNSVYTYLLLCEHFSQTCVVAETEGRIDGFVSGYIKPDSTDVLFIWQVAVHERARGTRLGQRMLQALLGRPQLRSVRYLETTVGPDNVASRRMFQGLATQYRAAIHESALFDSSLFGPDGHDDEPLIRIGPITHTTIEEHNNES